ncbi:MAG TPA: hypothetical protein DEH22_13625 [Chloroflexi bacterium]|nr:hypothetical protein [Chloroflexota bacterium]
MNEIPAPRRAQLGCWVEIDLIARSGARERLEFDLVPDGQADYQAGFLGVSTPLAKAILGEAAGTLIPYFTEELMGVEILSINESSRKPAQDAAARRQSAVNEARDQIEFTNAVLFAASTDTKWGEYDADGLDYEGWKARESRNSVKNEPSDSKT